MRHKACQHSGGHASLLEYHWILQERGNPLQNADQLPHLPDEICLHSQVWFDFKEKKQCTLIFRTISCHKKHTVQSSVILQQNCKISQSFGRENYFEVNRQTQNTHPCTHVVPLVFLRSFFLPIFDNTQIHSVLQGTRQPIFQHVSHVYVAGKTLELHLHCLISSSYHLCQGDALTIESRWGHWG